jgi:hypothetical protein
VTLSNFYVRQSLALLQHGEEYRGSGTYHIIQTIYAPGVQGGICYCEVRSFSRKAFLALQGLDPTLM